MTDQQTDQQAPGWVRGRGWGWCWGEDDEIGALNAITPHSRLAAIALARSGEIVDLGVAVDKSSFLWAGHVSTEVVSYRTPDGIRRGGDLAPVGSDPAGLSFRTSMVVMSDHAGTQLDSLAHATTGADNHWYNGFTDARWGTDFGPRKAGGEAIPPVIARGVLLDVAGYLGVDALAPGQAIAPADLEAVARSQGTDLRVGDVVCIRTGSLRYWGEAGHDRAALAGPDTAGITLATARWLCEEHGPVVVASDTSTVEVIPAVDGTAAQPVHEYLLVQQGVYLGELHFLEELAARRVHEFCYIALCPKVRGTTAGFALRPIALL
jgi:kynurenine formamidase